MPGLKYLYVTCLCLIVYSFMPPGSETESAEVYGRGSVIDNFSIEELLSSHPKPIRDVRTDELRIRSGWTYNKGAGITPSGSENRFYSPSFSVSNARIICWELIIEHQPAPVDRNLNFNYSLYGVDDYNIADAVADSWVPAGSDLTEHSACWGSAYPGSWEKGDYRYRIQYKSGGTDEQSVLEHSIKFTLY